VIHRRFQCRNPDCAVINTKAASGTAKASQKSKAGGNGKGSAAKPAAKTKSSGHSYTFSLFDPQAFAALPKDIALLAPMPPAVSRNAGGLKLGKAVISLLVASCGSGGSSCHSTARTIQELHQRRYLDYKQRYYERARTYSSSQESSTRTWSATKFSAAEDGGKYGMHVPGYSALLEALKRELAGREKMHWKQLTMQGPGSSGVIRVDASYKICKIIKVRLSTRAAACCYTMMSGDGVVLGSWLLEEEGKECLGKCVDGIKRRFKLHGYTVAVVYGARF
jgi:hypothetical protein